MPAAIPEVQLQFRENDPAGLSGPVFRTAEVRCKSGSYRAPIARARSAFTRAATVGIINETIDNGQRAGDRRCHPHHPQAAKQGDFHHTGA